MSYLVAADCFVTYGHVMTHKTVRLDEETYDAVLTASKIHTRSVSKQIAHWVSLGRIIERSSEFDMSRVEAALTGKLPMDDLTALEAAVHIEKFHEYMREPSEEVDKFYNALGEEVIDGYNTRSK